MKCKNCGKFLLPFVKICPRCRAVTAKGGRLLPHLSEDVPRRRVRRRRAARRKENWYMKKHLINWAWVTVGVLFLLLLTVAGTFVFLHATPQGQVILARRGDPAPAAAYWTVGEEHLDRGYVQDAVNTMSYARTLDESPELLLKKLFLLAEAHEANQDDNAARDVYLDLIALAQHEEEKIKTKPTVTDETGKKNESEALKAQIRAHRLLISLYEKQNLLPLTAEALQKAYDATGNISFLKDRNRLVPQAPVASLTGGRHMFKQTVRFYSEQGYKVMYTDDDADLPEGGKEFTEDLTLDEGVYQFRAVAVADDMVSDEMVVKYTIALPVPVAPRANVQPGEYSKPFKVKLRNIDEDKTGRMYYTIDGSKPTELSPEFTGDPIQLPAGRVTLRAILINKYGKTSNELVMDYKIKGPALKKRYTAAEDTFRGITPLATTEEDFIRAFGEPADKKTLEQDEGIKGAATVLTYPWGEARFYRRSGVQTLYAFSSNDAAHTGPRGTKVGMRLDDVIHQFQDHGQLPGIAGDRALYLNYQAGYGAYTASPESKDNGTLEYNHLDKDPKTQGTSWLTYDIQNGVVSRIRYRYSDILQAIIR